MTTHTIATIVACRHARITLLFLPLLWGCAGAAPQPVPPLPDPSPEAAKLLLFEATSAAGAKVFLLGSIHVADKSFYPLDSTVENAYESSDALVVEADTTTIEPLELMKLVVRSAGLPQGVSLQDKVSPETYGQLERFLAERGVPMANVNSFEPWWVAMNVQILRLKEQGLTGDDGIDRHFLDRSHAATRIVLELESVESQLAMLDGLSADLQEMMLLDSLVGGLQSGGDVQLMIEAWKRGDAAALEKLVFAELESKPALAPLKEVLFTNRNLAMAEKIESMAAPGKTLFVVVGAGHVVGDQGLVTLLSAKGYNVRQLERAPNQWGTP